MILVVLSPSWHEPNLGARAPSLQADLSLTAAAWHPRKRARSGSSQPQRLSAALRARESLQAAADKDLAAEAAPLESVTVRCSSVHADDVSELVRAAAAPEFMSFLAELGQADSLSPPGGSDRDAHDSAISLAADGVHDFTAEASAHSSGLLLATPPASPANQDQPKPGLGMTAAEQGSPQSQPAFSERDSDRTAGPYDGESARLAALQLPSLLSGLPDLSHWQLDAVIAPDASIQQPPNDGACIATTC